MNRMEAVMVGCDVVKLLYSREDLKQACEVLHCQSWTQEIF